jgi:hypothetical protein
MLNHVVYIITTKLYVVNTHKHSTAWIFVQIVKIHLRRYLLSIHWLPKDAISDMYDTPYGEAGIAQSVQ